MLRKLNIKHHLFPSDFNMSSSQSSKSPQNNNDCIHGYHLLGNKETALLHYCIVPHVRSGNELRAANKNHPSTVVPSDLTHFCQNKKHNLTQSQVQFSPSLRVSEDVFKSKKGQHFPGDPSRPCVCVFFIRLTLTFTHFFDPVSVLCLPSTIL